MDKNRTRSICGFKGEGKEGAPAEDGRRVDLGEHGVKQAKIARVQVQLSSQHRTIRLKQKNQSQHGLWQPPM